MNFKGLMAMTAAVALTATPALAAATSAARALAPATESVEGSEAVDGGTWLIIGLAVAAAGAGVWALADGGGNGVEAPVSP